LPQKAKVNYRKKQKLNSAKIKSKIPQKAKIALSGQRKFVLLHSKTIANENE